MKNKGISLIVLVITIIIMIIIASTVIISLSNTNIISKAEIAVSETNRANIKDAIMLKHVAIEAGTISVPEGKEVGEYIRDLLIEDKIITKDQPIVINDSGEFAEVFRCINIKRGTLDL